MNQLYDVRDRMLNIASKYDKFKQVEIDKSLAKPKTYTGPAQAFTDTEKSKVERKKELKARKNQQWQGREDIELICDTFMNFLTTPAALGTYGVHEARDANRSDDQVTSRMKKSPPKGSK